MAQMLKSLPVIRILNDHRQDIVAFAYLINV
jgi:hypothetical protein